MNDHEWLDAEAGPVVRPFALTGGRTRPDVSDFDLMTLVVQIPEPLYGSLLLGPEHEMILDLCRTPASVAEIASSLDLAIGVVRVLLGDLLTEGRISVRAQAPLAQPPSSRIIKEVIDGLQAL